MTVQLPNIPALSSKVDNEVKRAFAALKDWFTKANSDGGVVTAGSLGQGLSSVNQLAGFFDGTIPPQLENFEVQGAFATIMLTWDYPRYKWFSLVEVWRNTVDDLGTAQLIGSSISTMYADTPPNASLSVTYYYWARVISAANIIGPFNATAGTAGHTANDPAYVLEVLSDQLTASQLHIDLNSRIDLIDADNVGIVAVLDKLGTALAGLTAADSDRWERLLFERQVTDATVEVAPMPYCTLSAYTTEGTCVAAGGVWKPGGTIRLKATADITSDIDASLRTLQSLYDAINGTVTTLNGVTTAHTNAIASYLTDSNSSIVQLANGLAQKASSSYVDLKTDSIATAADVATYASQNDIPQALAYMVLHADDAAKKLRGAGANIAAAQMDITANADALEAVAAANLQLATKVEDNTAALIVEQEARSTAVSAVAQDVEILSTTVGGHTATIQTQQESIDGVYAQYMVKVDVNGKVVGFGLVNDGATSKMLVEVDEFAILKPGAAAGTLPALSVLTTPQTINGVTIPAGVYIDGASIAHLTAGDVVARGLSTDSLVAKAGTIFESIIDHQVVTDQYIGDTIQSTVYAPGPGGTGWMIDKAGTIRGQGIVVEDASITTAKIGNNQVTFSDGYSPSDIVLEAGNGTSIQIATRTFSGFGGSRVLISFNTSFYFEKPGDYSAYNCIANIVLTVTGQATRSFSAVGYPGGQLSITSLVSPATDGSLTVAVSANSAMRMGGSYDVRCHFNNLTLSVITMRR